MITALKPVIKNIIKHSSCLEEFCVSNIFGFEDIKNKKPKIKIKEEVVKTDGFIFFV